MIRVEKTHLPVAALTHPGMKGKNNEDRFGVSAFRIKAQPGVPILLAVLSDGIGGNRAGEVASELAVNIISQQVSESDGGNPQAILEEAIHFASDQIYQQAQEHLEQHGMGATCACAWISGDRLYTATVGDSRIYLMRADTIQQLSIDHTWVQEALERGVIQPGDVNGHPNAHVIRRYLGSPTPPEVDFRIRFIPQEDEQKTQPGQGFRLLPGDRILLCSDGLTDLVSNTEILQAFQQNPLEEAGHRLVDLANERGGHDNITLVAMQMPEPNQPVSAAAPAKTAVHSRRLLAGCLGVVVLAVLAGALAGGWLLYSGGEASTPTPTLLSPGTLTATVSQITPTQSLTPKPVPNQSETPVIPTPTIVRPGATPLAPGAPQPSITPWPTNTPGLPIVTVAQ